ncbi:MAG: permease [Thalassobius sp.]|nr:permease [Thalassovita sp.]
MDILTVIGYLGGILIGVSLGLIGGGGSILTVPILVYLMGTSPVVATAYSLFIVGFSSLVGSINYIKKNRVSIKTAAIFGLPSIIAIYSTRKYLVPSIPHTILTIGDFTLTKDHAVMILFAMLMIAASYNMIKKNKNDLEDEAEPQKFNYPAILLEGIVVGTLTGLVGAGGGFLIIPALVILSKLPMKMAVGTSLLIIATNSLIGFLGDVSNYEIDWSILGIFSTMAIGGIFIGTWLSNFISGKKLKPAFGVFVLVMGISIILKELL